MIWRPLLGPTWKKKKHYKLKHHLASY
jgi:hypothetical protein